MSTTFWTDTLQSAGLKMAIGTLALLLASGAYAECSKAEVLEDKCLISSEMTKEAWLDAWLGTKPFDSTMKFSRFLDRTYYLLSDLTWTPRQSIPGVTRITIPKGFVTDFASVPRIFWSVLPPDDEYVIAAVLHDWLYWEQLVSRERADDIFRIAMEELGIEAWKVWAVHRGVVTFGGAAWDENRRLKLSGERRRLKVEPTDPTIPWSVWRLRPGVLE